MSVEETYNCWASQYDGDDNRTRDLEGAALRETLEEISFERCLEIGCGTGKNTVWLAERAKQVTAVDLSGGMIAKAKEKIGPSDRVAFKQADVTGEWTFCDGHYDLITFSLVLEHIKDLEPVFKNAADVLRPGGHVYIGELHPFKQYTGSKARFETGAGQRTAECYNHHISDFTRSAKQHRLALADVKEYFDDNSRTGLPRILTILLKKS